MSQQQQQVQTDDDNDEVMITLLSSDNVVFTLPKNAAILSDLIADIINIDSDSYPEHNHNNNATLSSSSTSLPQQIQNEGYKLERVASSTLAKVVEFLINYNKNPMQPIPDVVLSTYVDICVTLLVPHIKMIQNDSI